MLAYFGTDMDGGKGTIRVDMDGVEGISTEQSNEKWSLSLLKVDLPGNGVEEVSVDELFLGIPDVAALFKDNRVLVRVVVVGSEARQGGKEVLKGNKVDSEGGEEAGRRWWGGGSNCGDRGFKDRQENILNQDVLVGNMVDDFSSELELCPILLIKWREEEIKFFLGNVDNMGGSFFTKLFKVKLGCGAKGFKGRLWDRWG